MHTTGEAELLADRLTRAKAPLGIAIAGGLFLLAVLGLSSGPPVAGAQEASERERYITQLEPICFRDTQRNARILRGTQEMVANDQLIPAARRFARATRAFTGTLRQALDVPRPQADRRTLSNWFNHLFRQRGYLAQITRALIDGESFQSQRLSVQLIRNASQANTVVRGYGFNHCLLRPGRFL